LPGYIVQFLAAFAESNMTKRTSAKTLAPATGAANHGIIPPPAVTVLHVDDDPNDTELLRAAARKADVRFELHNVEDADQAIAFLTGKEPYADRNVFRAPSLILLDLKMPRATGFEVLKWIREHPNFAQVPVVVLSGSELQDDIQLAYNVGANSYMVKPLGFDALVQLVKNINAAWIAALPSASQQVGYTPSEA
jgi:CheY-like chemotaxis protein